MTAKDREIQVYEMNEDQIPSDWPRDFVAYADHLRAVKLAQIEALEEISDAADLFVASTVDRDAEWVVTQKSIATKIDALREELEGPISAEPETTTNRITNRGWIDD